MDVELIMHWKDELIMRKISSDQEISTDGKICKVYQKVLLQDEECILYNSLIYLQCAYWNAYHIWEHTA